jgi:MFS family permease
MREAASLLQTPGFRAVLFVGGALSLVTISDSFLYLSLQDQLDFNIGFFPLLFVATALVYMILAVPFGRLADRIGRAPVFLAGYAVLALAYASLLVPSPFDYQFVLTIGLLGAYYAMTDGVLHALASSLIPEELRGTGLGLLTTATGISRLIASIVFGVIWTVWGLHVSVIIFLIGLLAIFVLAVLTFRRTPVGAAHA